MSVTRAEIEAEAGRLARLDVPDARRELSSLLGRARAPIGRSVREQLDFNARLVTRLRERGLADAIWHEG